MEQRPLRLGDIVDDYCTRERRVTNHAIVAVVGDAIRQTRCTTCDTEHPYKGAKEPRLRKKPSMADLDPGVLADTNGEPQRSLAASTADAANGDTGSPADSDAARADADASESDTVTHDEGWPAHRRLIRATLPRTENEPPTPRPIPEFTMHQRPPSRGARGFRFRGSGDGNGPGANGFGGGRPGQPSGRPGRRRGKKRPR